MEVQEYPAAQRDESLDKQSVHESLADAVVSQSAHEAEQSMHEALSSVPPMIPEGEESTEKTRDPTVSLSSCTPNSTESNSKDVARLHPNRLRKMIYEAQYLVREHKKMLNEAKKPSQKTHVVWELYCGKGRLSNYVNTLPGCCAEKFGYEQGWDFSRPADRRAFLRRLREEEPDDIMISPECKLWSPLQELTANRSPEALQFLVDARQENHDTHLTFVSVVYQAQYRAGRHATI